MCVSSQPWRAVLYCTALLWWCTHLCRILFHCTSSRSVSNAVVASEGGIRLYSSPLSPTPRFFKGLREWSWLVTPKGERCIGQHRSKAEGRVGVDDSYGALGSEKHSKPKCTALRVGLVDSSPFRALLLLLLLCCCCLELCFLPLSWSGANASIAAAHLPLHLPLHITASLLRVLTSLFDLSC